MKESKREGERERKRLGEILRKGVRVKETERENMRKKVRERKKRLCVR